MKLLDDDLINEIGKGLGMKKETTKTKYAVLEDAQYYPGDCFHPRGWSLSPVIIRDADRGVIDCIGTLEECREWVEHLNACQPYLFFDKVSLSYRIAEVLVREINYQTWADWNGCPSPSDANFYANVAWAVNKAYHTNGVLSVRDMQGRSVLVDLSSTGVEIETEE